MILAPLEVEAGGWAVPGQPGLYWQTLSVGWEEGTNTDKQKKKLRATGKREEALVVDDPPPLSPSCPKASLLLLAGE